MGFPCLHNALPPELVLDPPAIFSENVWAKGAHRALCPRCVKVGSFPPGVAMGPGVLNCAPYSPCWYTRDACHGSQGPEFCTPDAVLNGSCTLL